MGLHVKIITEMNRLSNWRLALAISATYTLLGTIYSYYAMSSMMSSDIWFLLFFPVSFLPQLILFTESNPFYIILAIQTVIMFLVAAFIWVFIKAARED